MKEFSTIGRTLLRNKTAVALTVFQVALAVAVLINSYASIDGYREIVADDMGIAQDQLITVSISMVDAPESLDRESISSFYSGRVLENLDTINTTSGVRAASLVDSFPMSDAAPVRRVRLSEDDEASTLITMYTADHDYLKTLGARLFSGRDFRRDDAAWAIDGNLESRSPFITISQQLADTLFPDEEAVGKQVYIGETQLTISGVVERLPGLHPLWNNAELSAVVPARMATEQMRVLVRADAASMDATISALEERLSHSTGTTQIVDVRSLHDLKRRTLSTASSTLKILGFVSAFLLLVTALGTYGQTAFMVTKRTKETGIKRAIGATRGDVISYYLVENSVITGIGLALGLILAYLLNVMLVYGLGATKIDAAIIIPGIVFMWILGLISSLLPAWRASRIAPAAATRMA